MSVSVSTSEGLATGLPNKVLDGVGGFDFSLRVGECAIEMCAVTGALAFVGNVNLSKVLGSRR